MYRELGSEERAYEDQKDEDRGDIADYEADGRNEPRAESAVV